VEFKFARHCEVSRPRIGECEFYQHRPRTLIHIFHPDDRDKSDTAMAEKLVENTVVHELLHPHFWWMDYKADTTEGLVKRR
jgi:hypothetical protein